MDAITLGPLVMPMDRLVALLAAHFLRRREPLLSDWVTWSLVAAIVGARLAHVVTFPAPFLEAPWTILFIWQDGFAWWGALLGAALVSAWYLWRHGMAPRWMAATMLPGLVVGVAGVVAVLVLAPDTARLDRVVLEDLEGSAVELAASAGEEGSGVFLWATWCGVCHRMMPDVIRAARQSEQRQWFLVSVGEDAETVTAYMDGLEQSLPDNVTVLLDGDSRLLHRWQAHGVPTTLLFDAEGRQQDRFMGQRSLSRLLAR